MDVLLDFARLSAAKSGLSTSIRALEEASATNDALESAIGNPDDRTSLRNKASEFETAWHRKRGALLDNLRDIEEHLGAIITDWKALDLDSAASLENAATQQNRAE